MRTMASQLANTAEYIKLPGGQYTQYGDETIRELNRVNLLERPVQAMTLEREGQPNLIAFVAHREE
jgi:hypothetical protein